MGSAINSLMQGLTAAKGAGWISDETAMQVLFKFCDLEIDVTEEKRRRVCGGYDHSNRERCGGGKKIRGDRGNTNGDYSRRDAFCGGFEKVALMTTIIIIVINLCEQTGEHLW
jgi:hypothetical protein